MFTKKFAQPRATFRGSGAVSHAYVQYPPLRCNVPGAKGLFYDDGNKLVLLPTTEQVCSWKTISGSSSETASVDSIRDGPILSIRYSLDGKIIGIQRSNHEVEFRNRETGSTFCGRCRVETESILGFFWTDCPTCEVVFIKTSGLDLYSCDHVTNALHLVETKRLNVNWYVYTHESRLVLLAAGMQCNSLMGFQFSSGGIIRLPKFEMSLAKTEVNSKLVLNAEDVHIVTVYGRIYCLQVDRVGMLLHLYRFYRDAVIQQGSVPIYCIRVAVSVVDNVLLVHQVDAKVALLYDLFLNQKVPVSAPLPILVTGLPEASNSASETSSSQSELANYLNDEGTIYRDGCQFLVPDLVCDVSRIAIWRISLDLEAIAASSSEVPSLLEFLQRRRSDPNKVKEICLSLVRTIMLERRPVTLVGRAMDVLTASYSHYMKLESVFKAGLQKAYSVRSSTEGDGSPVANAQSIGVTADQRASSTGVSPNRSPTSVSVLEKTLKLNLTLEDPQRTSASDLPGPSTNPDGTARDTTTGRSSMSESIMSPMSSMTGIAISPDDMYDFVFAPVDEEMTGDPVYLVTIILEYLRSLATEKVKVPPSLYILAIQLLSRSGRYAELRQFVIHKVFEPSKEVALQLIKSGLQNLPTRKLGIDMLRQLHLHPEYVMILLHDGHYLEALRYVQKNKVYTVRPSLFLEAAVSADDPLFLASALRFFTDFKPDFKTTSEYERYRDSLNEMYTKSRTSDKSKPGS